MDELGKDIGQFLHGCLQIHQQLVEVGRHYERRGLVARYDAVSPILSTSSICYGIYVIGSDGRHYILEARMHWPGEAWIVESDATIEPLPDDADYPVYPLLRQGTRTVVVDRNDALEEFAAAVAGLAAFDDLIPN